MVSLCKFKRRNLCIVLILCRLAVCKKCGYNLSIIRSYTVLIILVRPYVLYGKGALRLFRLYYLDAVICCIKHKLIIAVAKIRKFVEVIFSNCVSAACHNNIIIAGCKNITYNLAAVVLRLVSVSFRNAYKYRTFLFFYSNFKNVWIIRIWYSYIAYYFAFFISFFIDIDISARMLINCASRIVYILIFISIVVAYFTIVKVNISVCVYISTRSVFADAVVYNLSAVYCYSVASGCIYTAAAAVPCSIAGNLSAAVKSKYCAAVKHIYTAAVTGKRSVI